MKFIKSFFAVGFFNFILAYFFMLFWNWIIPSMFNLREINFFEGWGIAIIIYFILKVMFFFTRVRREAYKAYGPDTFDKN